MFSSIPRLTFSFWLCLSYFFQGPIEKGKSVASGVYLAPEEGPKRRWNPNRSAKLLKRPGLASSVTIHLDDENAGVDAVIENLWVDLCQSSPRGRQQMASVVVVFEGGFTPLGGENGGTTYNTPGRNKFGRFYTSREGIWFGLLLCRCVSCCSVTHVVFCIF
jgi:hypothetical protein